MQEAELVPGLERAEKVGNVACDHDLCPHDLPIDPGPGDIIIDPPKPEDMIKEFDGGGGPDCITPIGPGPGTILRMEFQITSPLAQMHDVHRLSSKLHQLINFACDSMSISIPAHGLNSTGNEVAVFEGYGVSLKADGNEVTIIQSLDIRSVEEPWLEWSHLNGSANAALLLLHAAELNVLLWECELGMRTEREFSTELKNAVQTTLFLSGF